MKVMTEIILDVLIEQLGENLDEARGGSKPRHIDQRWKQVERLVTFEFFVISLQCGLFT
jgi:hypothetical protein